MPDSPPVEFQDPPQPLNLIDAGRGNRVSNALLIVGGLLAIVYIILPYGQIASALYVAATALAAIAIFAAAYRLRLFCPIAWLLIAAALALAAIGHGIWYWLDLQGLEPFPSLADAFYLAVYPLFIIALWKLGGRASGQYGALSDALVVGVSAAVLSWTFLIVPYGNDPDLTAGQLIVSAAYPVADVILLPMILRLLFLHRSRLPAHVFLLTGMLAYFVADVLYAHGNSASWYQPGGFTDAWWLLAYTLFAAAAWHSSATLEPPKESWSRELTNRRLFILGIAAALVPAVILITAGSDVETVRVAAIGSILLFLLMMQRMAGLVKETHQQAQQLELLSRTDALTGTANRRYLEYLLIKAIATAEHGNSPLQLAFFDLDHFKRFNDQNGHAAGDKLLQQLAANWRSILPSSDVLARFGGDEFVLLMTDTSAADSVPRVEALCTNIPFDQSCSVGIASYRSGDTADSLITRADDALYAAKEKGRNQIAHSDDETG